MKVLKATCSDIALPQLVVLYCVRSFLNYTYAIFVFRINRQADLTPVKLKRGEM
jgi:hypothetical protein